MKKRTLVGIVLIMFLLGGCYNFDNFENIRIEPIEPEYVLPLVNSTISFRELVERSDANTLVGVLPGTTMFYMAFRDTMPLFFSGEQFQMSDIGFSQGITIPNNLVPPSFPSGQQIQIDTLFTEIINPVMGNELKEIQLTGGEMVIRIVNNFQHQVSGLLTIRSLKNSNNVMEVLPLDLSGYSSSVTYNRPLNNYLLSLFNEDEGLYNAFDYEAKIVITSSGNPSLEGSLDISIDIQQPQYGLLVGKFNSSFQNDYIKYYISVFNSTILADQYFAEPSLNLTIQNSFGVPISLNLPKFEFRNENNGNVIPITNSTQIENGLNIGSPNIVEPITETEQDYLSSLFILNTQNSNLVDAFELAPNVLAIATHFNIGDDTDNHDYFVRDNSSVNLISEIVLPLYGRITTHVLTDTLPNLIDEGLFEEGDDTQDNAKIVLKFKFTNELPFDMAFQAEFLDEDGNVVDSFFSEDENEWFIESAPVGANGESNGSTPKYSNIELTKDRYMELSGAANIVFYYKLHTGGEEGINVKVLSTNRISVQLSIYASLSIDIDK